MRCCTAERCNKSNHPPGSPLDPGCHLNLVTPFIFHLLTSLLFPLVTPFILPLLTPLIFHLVTPLVFPLVTPLCGVT